VGGKLTQNPNVPIPGTKYKRSNSIFLVTSIALICRRVWSQLLQSLAQSLIRGPGTLVVPLPNLSSGTNNLDQLHLTSGTSRLTQVVLVRLALVVLVPGTSKTSPSGTSILEQDVFVPVGQVG